MILAGLPIGLGHPCRIIAEVSNNHNGDLHRAFRLLDAIKAAGADIVKFQCYTPEELVALRGDGPAPAQWGAQGWTMRDLYTKAQTPHAWFPELVAHCERIGLPWFSSVFGLASLALLESLNCPAYKVAALDSHSTILRDAVIATGKPVIVSLNLGNPHPLTDTTDDQYTDADEVWRRVHLLWCPKGYPSEIADTHLIQFDQEGYLGLSSHCVAPELPIAAVARGAKVLEMHVMLRDEPSELEANVSLDEYQLADMIRSVRRTEAMLA